MQRSLLPGQRPTEAVRGPVRDGPGHHRLAVGERERPVVTGAPQPRCDRRIAQQLVEGGGVAGSDRAQVEHVTSLMPVAWATPPSVVGNEWPRPGLRRLANM